MIVFGLHFVVVLLSSLEALHLLIKLVIQRFKRSDLELIFLSKLLRLCLQFLLHVYDDVTLFFFGVALDVVVLALHLLNPLLILTLLLLILLQLFIMLKKRPFLFALHPVNFALHLNYLLLQEGHALFLVGHDPLQLLC